MHPFARPTLPLFEPVVLSGGRVARLSCEASDWEKVAAWKTESFGVSSVGYWKEKLIGLK